MIEIGLDNPKKECVPVKTDYKYMVYVLKKQKKCRNLRKIFGNKYVPAYGEGYYSLP